VGEGGEGMKDILVLAPHADDEMFGMGGTLLKMMEEGRYNITICLVVAGCVEFVEMGKTISGDVREREFRESAKVLSNKVPVVLDFGVGMEGKLDLIPIKMLVTQFDRIVRELQPDTLFVPHPSYYMDHEIVYRAALSAVRPSVQHSVKNVIVYENPGEASSVGSTFKPNMYVDVTEQAREKIELIRKIYLSQISGNRGCYSLEAMDNYLEMRGAEMGVRDAEAFNILRLGELI